ncbi:steroid 21-hydroxylase-like isoform X1 [Molothrus ater]|uniref:steroid 21-hydroxylase-like isoform X1 n=1 Tax=Molothrus ater TaxID=84834 RepID=UPI00174ECBF1|nr:steroid 21-hydroxylase-like isoform X1 [Molothrus ater]
MAAAALLLGLLSLLLSLSLLSRLSRRGDGRGPRWGALHLLHPQGALHLSRLARRHGPVLRLRAGGREVLVPSSVATIREALVRHWGDWLGRPHSYLGSLVSRGGRDLALGGPCPGWRRQRGAVRGALARAGGRLGPLLWLQGQNLCEELRSHGEAPLDPFEVFTFHTCSTIARLLFGELVPPPGELRAFSRCLGELLQVWGHSSVRVLDLLPLLRALPNPGLRKLLQLVQHRDTFVETQIQRHQACPSPPPDTVLGALLGRNPGARGGPLSPPRLHMALVDLFIGGTETTAAALGWAVAFLLHRPELQARLRAELQGAQGPPGPGDVGRLPLLQATVSETLRLRPPAPLALPHCALRHTSLGGLPVAAGTVLVPNLLAAQQDPDIWQHPEVFLPERFLAPGAPSRSLLPFGCGARSCPGEGLARAELFVFLGLILREFRLEPGPEGLPGLRGSPGTVLRCPSFRLRMVPCQPRGLP